MNYKVVIPFILLCLNANQVRAESTTSSAWHKTITWAKSEPKKTAIILSSILIPALATWGYCFHYDEILAFINSLSYKVAETSLNVAQASTNGALNAAVDSVISDPGLIAKLTGLGLAYQTIFVGIPLLLTKYIEFKLGVKK